MRILLFLLLLFSLTGCRKGDTSESLSTDKRILRYDFVLTRDTVAVTCGLPVGWQARSTQEWVTVNKLDNKRLEIVAQTNAGNEERNGYIEISAGGMGVTLIVLQGYDPVGQPMQTADSLALVALYDATDGKNWHFEGDDDPASVDTRWNLTKPMRTWSGVECYREEGQYRVRKLDLTGRGAVGALPPQIVNLTALKSFIARGNRLSAGSLAILEKLPVLAELDLSGNIFGSNIAELPLEALRGLESLNLSNNRLTGSLPDFSGWPHLRALGLEGNELSGNIDIVRPLRGLEVLSLSGSLITGAFPEWIGELENLRSLTLTDCDLSGSLPTGMGRLEALETLVVTNCGISGEVPAELGNLRKLQTLNLSYNTLTGVANGAVTSPLLETLDLTNNKLTSVSNDLGTLTSLKRIDLSHNELTRIEGSWEGMRSLEQMTLTNNRLTALPIGTMTIATLRSLIAANNQLAVLPSIFTLKKLEIVILASNAMSGQVPEWLSDLPLLKNLDLSNNYLIGTIPGSVVRCSMLSALNLSGNNLGGLLPPDVVSDSRWNGSWNAAINICPQRGDKTFTNCGHTH